MKRIVHDRLGDPAEVLSLVEEPSRAPGAGEARVRVLGTPIHPSNLLQISGQYGRQADLPATPGAEGVGEVVETGEGVEHLSPGQMVLLAGGGGTWRDEITGPAQGFIPVPGGDPEQLAMVAVNPMTAHLLLTSFETLSPGDWIVQSAANSAVGEAVIQLAAARGLRTLNVVRREGLAERLTALGADRVLVDGEGLAKEVTAATGGAGPRLALDAVGGETFARLAGSLPTGGTIVSYGVMSGRPATLDLGAVIFRDIRVRGFWLEAWYRHADAAARQAAFGALLPAILGGQLVTSVDSRFPLERIADAVTRAAEGARDGKVLLVPGAD